MRIFAVTIAVLGGWFAILPASVQWLYLRVGSLETDGAASVYSLILAAGWAVFMVSLYVSGRFGDRQSTTRWRTLAAGCVGLVAGAALLLASPNTTVLAGAWVFLQIPAACVVSSSLALAITHTQQRRRRVVSALTGATPLFAILLGALATSIVTPPFVSLALAPVIGAIATLPLLWITHSRGAHKMALVGDVKSADSNSTPATSDDGHASPVSAPRSTRAWWAFLAVGFLLSCATSVTNGYIVVFTESWMRVPASDVAPTSSSIILLATLASLIAGLNVGSFVTRGRTAVILYSSSAGVVAASIGGMIIAPQFAVVTALCVLFGAAFGIANSLELTIVADLHPAPNLVGAEFAEYTIATTIPYIIIPALGAAILLDGGEGVAQLWWIAATCALAAATLGFFTVKLAGTRQRS